MYEIIVNPGSQSGNGLKIWGRLESVFKENNAKYRVHYTQSDDNDRQMFSELYNEYIDKKEVLHLVIMGGDGTVNVVLQHLPSLENIMLSVIPVGSGNDLVRDIDLNGSIKDRIIHLINNPVDKLTDIGVIHCENSEMPGTAIADQRFIVSTGIGYDAAICEEVMRSSIKNVLNKLGLGKLVYLVVALKQLAGLEKVKARLVCDGDEKNAVEFNEFMFLAGMNHRFEGGGFMFGPEAKSNDGLIELCSVNGVKKPKVLEIMPKATKGEHFAYDGVDHFRAASYTIHSSKPLWVHTDGEIRTMADLVSVEMKKEVIHLVY